jgi:hypothetical protein
VNDEQKPAAGNDAAPTDAGTATTPFAGTPPIADLSGVGRQALEQHFTETPRRGPGRPRKIPLAGVGNGAGKTPGQAPGAVSNSTGQPTGQPAFDEETVKAVVSGLIGCANDMAEGMMRSYAFTHSKNNSFAEQAGKMARMGEKTENLVRVGAMGCWKKYGLNFQYVEETALIGGVALWLGGISIQCKKIAYQFAPAAPAPETATGNA